MRTRYDREEDVARVCREAFPDLPEAELASLVHDLWHELERLRRNWSNSQKRYYSHTWFPA